jgi:hypothetical protein
VTPTPTQTATLRPGEARCGFSPLGNCRTARRSKLVIRDKSPDKRDKLVWKWIKGETPIFPDGGDFGRPSGTTGYALCVYDAGNNFVMQLGVLPGGTCGAKPCWKEKRSFLPPEPPPILRAYQYRDARKPPLSDGIDKLLLKGDIEIKPPGKSKILVRAKKENVPDPGLVLVDPVVVELINSDSDDTGICWGDTYSGAEISRNSSTLFRARAKNP